MSLESLRHCFGFACDWPLLPEGHTRIGTDVDLACAKHRHVQCKNKMHDGERSPTCATETTRSGTLEEGLLEARSRSRLDHETNDARTDFLVVARIGVRRQIEGPARLDAIVAERERIEVELVILGSELGVGAQLREHAGRKRALQLEPRE